MNNHPNKEIRAAVDYAIEHGWRLIKSGPRAHVWGRLLCPHSDRSGCRQPIYSTPKHPQDHAKDIRRTVDSCPH
ncbi:MAG TPA: hypothetical protein VL096_06350 [Pirellulaceae bacterium]|nr:hypothetical protein [Pirellulaceae bacterium]